MLGPILFSVHSCCNADRGRAIPVRHEPNRWFVRDLRAPSATFRDILVPDAIGGRSETHLLFDSLRAYARVGRFDQCHVQSHSGRKYSDPRTGEKRKTSAYISAARKPYFHTDGKSSLQCRVLVCCVMRCFVLNARV